MDPLRTCTISAVEQKSQCPKYQILLQFKCKVNTLILYRTYHTWISAPFGVHLHGKISSCGGQNGSPFCPVVSLSIPLNIQINNPYLKRTIFKSLCFIQLIHRKHFQVLLFLYIYITFELNVRTLFSSSTSFFLLIYFVDFSSNFSMFFNPLWFSSRSFFPIKKFRTT